jgi:hypothetical protein
MFNVIFAVNNFGQTDFWGLAGSSSSGMTIKRQRLLQCLTVSRLNNWYSAHVILAAYNSGSAIESSKVPIILTFDSVYSRALDYVNSLGRLYLFCLLKLVVQVITHRSTFCKDRFYGL